MGDTRKSKNFVWLVNKRVWWWGGPRVKTPLTHSPAFLITGAIKFQNVRTDKLKVLFSVGARVKLIRHEQLIYIL